MPSKVGWGVSDQLQVPPRRGCASDHDCGSDRLRGCKEKSHNDSIKLFKLHRIFTNLMGVLSFNYKGKFSSLKIVLAVSITAAATSLRFLDGVLGTKHSQEL